MSHLLPWGRKELISHDIEMKKIPKLVPKNLDEVPGIWRWLGEGEPQPIKDKHVTISESKEYNKLYAYPATDWLSAVRGAHHVTILSGFETKAQCITEDTAGKGNEYAPPSGYVDVMFVKESVARGNAFLIQIFSLDQLKGYVILKYVDSLSKDTGRVLEANEWHIQVVATSPRREMETQPPLFPPLLAVTKAVALAYGGTELTLDSMNYYATRTEDIEKAIGFCTSKDTKHGFDLTYSYEGHGFKRYEHAWSTQESKKSADGSVPMSMSLTTQTQGSPHPL